MRTTITSLDDPEFEAYFTSFTDSAWRLETLQVYDVGYEQDAFERFLAGERDTSHIKPWIENVIAPAVEHGRDIGRVHIIERTTDETGRLALNDYLRFELWVYATTKAAGEDIRLAWVEPGQWIKHVRKMGHDFWLFDENTDHAKLMEMHYDPDGAFIKAVVTSNSGQIRAARKCKRAALRAAKLFYP